MSALPSLVDTSWLAENLNRSDIRVLDCSWHMPNSDRNGHEEFQETHIPGSLFFDIDEVSDKASPFPHMLPNEQDFADKMSEATKGAGATRVFFVPPCSHLSR